VDNAAPAPVQNQLPPVPKRANSADSSKQEGSNGANSPWDSPKISPTNPQPVLSSSQTSGQTSPVNSGNLPPIPPRQVGNPSSAPKPSNLPPVPARSSQGIPPIPARSLPTVPPRK